jgi:hypothetical protein
MSRQLKKTRIELNNAVFSLPDIVARAEGYFEQEGPRRGARPAFDAQSDAGRGGSEGERARGPYNPFSGTKA